jgi:hypothetical protein
MVIYSTSDPRYICSLRFWTCYWGFSRFQYYNTYFKLVDYALKSKRATVVVSSSTFPESRYTGYQYVRSFDKLRSRLTWAIELKTSCAGICGRTHVCPVQRHWSLLRIPHRRGASRWKASRIMLLVSVSPSSYAYVDVLIDLQITLVHFGNGADDLMLIWREI